MAGTTSSAEGHLTSTAANCESLTTNRSTSASPQRLNMLSQAVVYHTAEMPEADSDDRHWMK
jgi:hypothetical protein